MPRSAAVVLYPGCVIFEIAAVVELLARSCEVNYFAPDRNVHCASNGARLLPHGSYSDLAARTVDCVLVPGGNPDSILEPGSANECLFGASRQGALMAGICAGNLVLARAGLLVGRRATHNS